MPKDELQSLEDQISELRLKQSNLEVDRFRNKTVPLLESMVGTAFVYRNNSCGGPERWDSFRKCIRLVHGTYHSFLIFEQCDINGDGIPHIRIETAGIGRSGVDFPGKLGWESCEMSEYEENRKRVIAQLDCPDLAADSIVSKFTYGT